jgi:hypothetical protein
MKGIVFTEFIDMVEARYSPATVDQIIQAARLPSGGAYTSVATYDHAEMWSLLVELSKISGTPVPDLLRDFGVHLMGRFVAAFPALFQAPKCSFDSWKGWTRSSTAKCASSTPTPSCRASRCSSAGTSVW